MNYELNPPIQAKGILSGEDVVVLAVSDDGFFTFVYNEGSNVGKLRDSHSRDFVLTPSNVLLRAKLNRSGELLGILALLPSERVFAVYKSGANAGKAAIFTYSEITLDTFFWSEAPESLLQYGEHPQDA